MGLIISAVSYTHLDVYKRQINSCSVTQESERKARQMIGRVKRNHPGSHILVAGCYSQRDAAEVLSIQGVDAALGTADRSRIAEVLEGLELSLIHICSLN